MHAGDAEEVRQHLASLGFTCTKVKRIPFRPPRFRDLVGLIGQSERRVVATQLGTMVEAGLSLDLSIEILHGQSTNRSVRRELAKVVKAQTEGAAPLEAVRGARRLFRLSADLVASTEAQLAAALKAYGDRPASQATRQ
jgi:type II secretory pathway component PulF